jgi:hypothetical protein
MPPSSHPSRSVQVGEAVSLHLPSPLSRAAASTPSLQTKEPAVEWHPQQQDFTEFVPGQTFDNQMVGLVSFHLYTRPPVFG